jgi:hypothetical protein
MKKRVALVLLVSVTALFGLAASHATEPSDACESADPVSAVQLADGAVVCVNTGTVNGSVTARGDTDGNGFIAADGDSTNPGAAGGYLGAENGNATDGHQPAVVGCASGNYTPSDAPSPAANHIIVGADGTVNLPPDSCTPSP